MKTSSSFGKYLNFIDDLEFLREIAPNLDTDSKPTEDPEEFIFTSSPEYITATLREYQVDGLNWLVKMHENNINCILADEMGLGKTIQCMSFIGYLRFIKNEKQKHLIVVPKSCLRNWANEFKRFVPDLSVKVFHVSKVDIPREGKSIIHKKYDVILTTYEMCIFSKHVFSKINWGYLIVDEAHRLKNEESLLSTVLRSYSFRHHLLLTGTPLQNNIHELWALLNFIEPVLFNNSEFFERYLQESADGADRLQKLRKIVSLFILRREKMDVEQSLKPKKYMDIYCSMSSMQRKWYKAILKKDFSDLALHKDSHRSLLNMVMELKKCCNHPYLFDGAEPEPYENGEHIVYNSGKMLILDKLLAYLKTNNCKVLIFSQMARMLDILEDYLNYREYSYCRLDGGTSTEDRATAIDEFAAEDSDKFVFILTTRAGGLGINLWSANTVIHFDSDWNPQADLQAQDRAHRIGQKDEVKVFRLITEDTVEEGIFFKAQQKLKLDAMLVQNGSERKMKAFSEGELLNILAFGIDKPEAAEEGADKREDLCIEDIIKKGEEKTIEMNNRLSEFKPGVERGEKLDFYSWEGENYSKKKIQEFIGEDEEKVSRNLFYRAKKFNKLVFPDYQFYPKEFYELQDREEELVNKNQALSMEDQEKKQLLLEKGFNWTKKDYRLFLTLFDNCGGDFEKIRLQMPHKQDVQAYYDVFCERYHELSDATRVNNIFERMRMRSEKKSQLNKIFDLRNDEIEKNITYRAKQFADPVYLLRLYWEHIDDPQCFDRIKERLMSEERFLLDFFIQSRTVPELNKYLNHLMANIMKNLEGLK